MIKTGSDFSGVGAFDQALMRLGIEQDKLFACDMDRFARETYIHNYGEPVYYPENVYNREIPKESLDIYMTTPPCQAFSLAGKRNGEGDDRGVLFYNSHEFIAKNKPRYFIFENVKGLLSDAKGRTFQIWLDMLGGKSVNGNPVIFPREDATHYHIYYKVLNAKNFNIPQNRERVFIVGIRDDADNNFNWPKEIPLSRKLKHVLEPKVDSKYYLSDKMLQYLQTRSANFNNGKVNYKDENDTASCLTKSSSSIDISDNIIKVGNTNPSGNGMNGNAFHTSGICPTLSTNKGEGTKVMIGAMRGRNPDNPNSRITGDHYEQRLELNSQGISNTLSTVQKDNVVVYGNLKGGKWDRTHEQSGRVYDTNGISPTIHTMAGGNQEPKIYQGIAVHPTSKKLEFDGFKDRPCPTLLATDYKAPKCIQYTDYAIRKLTPRECFRLMDFPDTFTWPVSNSQAYKQAGNSICVGVLAAIINKLNFKTNKTL